MHILVTGGAGYVGSATVRFLLKKKYKVTVIDNFSTGKTFLLPKKINLIKSDISDTKKLKKFFKKNNFDAVIHLAAFIKVSESVSFPKKYLLNNFLKTKKFINLCIKFNLKNIIFASSAAVYGISKKIKVSEKDFVKPINPYGISKLLVEKYLIDLKKSKSINYIILRYFNIIGADPDGNFGPLKNNTSLIKTICKSIILKKIFYIFGNNYPTKDGTTIRDFIDINKIAEINYKACKFIISKKKCNRVMNCGSGRGYSVMTIFNLCQKFLTSNISLRISKPAAFDIPEISANINLLKKTLKINTSVNLKKSIMSMYRWEKKIKYE
jgi:UDP-glucose 4-epimerase